MCAPLFIKNYDYLQESGGVSEKEFLEGLSAKLLERYAEFNASVQKESLFFAKTEDS